MFGLAVREGRLYYAVAKDCRSGRSRSPRTASAPMRASSGVPPGQGASEISKIAFDHQGRKLLGERPAPTGATISRADSGGRTRVALAMRGQGPGAARLDADEYAIGFAAQRAAAMAASPSDTATPAAPRSSACGRIRLVDRRATRAGPTSALAARLAQGGSLNVNGLQGTAAPCGPPVPPKRPTSSTTTITSRNRRRAAPGRHRDLARLRARRAAAPHPTPGRSGSAGSARQARRHYSARWGSGPGPRKNLVGLVGLAAAAAADLPGRDASRARACSAAPGQISRV